MEKLTHLFSFAKSKKATTQNTSSLAQQESDLSFIISQESAYQILNQGTLITMEDDLKEATRLQKMRPDLIPGAVPSPSQSFSKITSQKTYFEPLTQTLQAPQPASAPAAPSPVSDTLPHLTPLKDKTEEQKSVFPPVGAVSAQPESFITTIPKAPLSEKTQTEHMPQEEVFGSEGEKGLEQIPVFQPKDGTKDSSLQAVAYLKQISAKDFPYLKQEVIRKTLVLLKQLKEITASQRPLLKQRNILAANLKQKTLALDKVIEQKETLLERQKQIEQLEAKTEDATQRHNLEQERWQVEDNLKQLEEKQWMSEEELEKARLALAQLDSDMQGLKQQEAHLRKEKVLRDKFLAALSALEQKTSLEEKIKASQERREKIEQQYNDIIQEQQKLKEQIAAVVEAEKRSETVLKGLRQQMEQVKDFTERKRIEQERWQIAEQRKANEQKRWQLEQRQQALLAQAQDLEKVFSQAKKEEKSLQQEIQEAQSQLEIIPNLPEVLSFLQKKKESSSADQAKESVSQKQTIAENTNSQEVSLRASFPQPQSSPAFNEQTKEESAIPIAPKQVPIAPKEKEEPLFSEKNFPDRAKSKKEFFASKTFAKPILEQKEPVLETPKPQELQEIQESQQIQESQEAPLPVFEKPTPPQTQPSQQKETSEKASFPTEHSLQEREKEQEQVMQIFKEQVEKERKALMEEERRKQEQERQKSLLELQKMAEEEERRKKAEKLRGPLLKEEILKKISASYPQEEKQRQEFLAKISQKNKIVAEGKALPSQEGIIFHPMIRKTSKAEKLFVRILLVLLMIGILAAVYFLVIFFLTHYKKTLVVPPSAPSQSLPHISPTSSEQAQMPSVIESSTSSLATSSESATEPQSEPSQAPEQEIEGALPNENLPEPAIPASLVPVSNVRFLQYNSVENSLSPDMASLISSAPQQGDFEQILMQEQDSKRFLSLGEMLELSNAQFPAILKQTQATSTFLLFGSLFGPRLGFVVQSNNGQEFVNAFRAWEKQAESQSTSFFALMGKSGPALNKYFKTLKYKNVSIRVLTISREDLGICYGLKGKYFIFTSSLQQMERLIDMLP